jgi:hypothetical protein
MRLLSNWCLELFSMVALMKQYINVTHAKRHYVNCKELLKTNWSFLMHVSLVFISCPQTLTFFNTISSLQPPPHTNRWSCSTLLCVVSLDFFIVEIGSHLLVPLMVLPVPVVM